MNRAGYETDPIGPGDGHHSFFQRLAQNLQGVPPELGQLVQEQNAVVGGIDLPEPGGLIISFLHPPPTCFDWPEREDLNLRLSVPKAEATFFQSAESSLAFRVCTSPRSGSRSRQPSGFAVVLPRQSVTKFHTKPHAFVQRRNALQGLVEATPWKFESSLRCPLKCGWVCRGCDLRLVK